MDIIKSTSIYQGWLRAQLQDEFVEKDWARKYEKMSDGPFPFLPDWIAVHPKKEKKKAKAK